MESRIVRVGDAALHVGVTGDGPDVVVLSGGPGCVQYLERDDLAPREHRAWFPEPRGVGRSGGGPHTMEEAVADLEGIRAAAGVDRWIVLGHSWGADLAVRYAVEHPGSVAAVVGVAGRGPQLDRTWSEAYEAGKPSEPAVEIDWVPAVHAALSRSFTEWAHRPDLWRGLADCAVPMRFVAAGDDIRPSWPLEQLAALVPRGRFTTVPGVPHDFWFTHPGVWTEVVTDTCLAAAGHGR
ncbi:alpha/beta fold hydrolase [Nucisporomicrobium flavum]|uniref:alpha/beta fold hydrolase n=1 Tax=Nucisporomicrobium flavum TaxID=2785915 RepID=UPI003C2D0E2B